MPIDQIDLKEIFKPLENKYYTIIKLPDEFPSYRVGSDLDIFCFNMQDISKHILGILQKYIIGGLTIQINAMHGQMYIDIMDDDNIHLRFDLFEKLPDYNNLNIKRCFFSSVIENSEFKQFYDFKVKVPMVIDETILRYIEYHEWYVQRPDKIKHIKYIENKIEKNEIQLEKFLDKLHFYIAIPKILENRKVSKFDSVRYILYFFEFVKRAFVMAGERGFVHTLKAIKKKLIK